MDTPASRRTGVLLGVDGWECEVPINCALKGTSAKFKIAVKSSKFLTLATFNF